MLHYHQNATHTPVIGYDAYNAAYRASKAAVLNLLIAQVKAAGTQKNDNILKFIAERITRLGGEMPAICVSSKRLEAVQELVKAALAVVPHLVTFSNRRSGLDGWYVTCVSSALSDAYKMATSEKVLGVELVALGFAEDAAAKARIFQGAVVTVKQYIALLIALVPLAYQRNPICGLWLNEKRSPGKPLQNLQKDLDRLTGMGKYLDIEDRIAFDKALDLARLAFTVRTERPITDEVTIADAGDPYLALAEMVDSVSKEMRIEKQFHELLHG